MRTALRYLVRPMRMDDIPQVLEVEHESFPTMWPPTAFKRELQQNRLARYIVLVEQNPEAGREPPPPERHHPGAIGRFIGGLRLRFGSDEARLPPPDQRSELVLGFIGLWMLPDEAHIVTIAVRESHRRRGLGELLLIRGIEMARESGHSLVTLEVRVSNEPALRLYDKYGFHQSGLRPRYYSDNYEDAFILTLGSVLTDHYRETLEGLKSEHRQRCGDVAWDGE